MHAAPDGPLPRRDARARPAGWRMRRQSRGKTGQSVAGSVNGFFALFQRALPKPAEINRRLTIRLFLHLISGQLAGCRRLKTL